MLFFPGVIKSEAFNIERNYSSEMPGMKVICDLSPRQLGDALKKNEQTHKDAEFYHAEAESIRTR